MRLTLSDNESVQLEAALRILPSPLEYGTTAGWAAAVLSTVQALFGAPRGMITLPLGDDLVEFGGGIDAAIVDRLQKFLVRPGAHGNEYADPELQRIMSRLVAARADIWNEDIAVRITRIPLPNAGTFYHEVLRPGRLEHMWVAGAVTPVGHALLGVFHDSKDDNRYGEASFDLLRLLTPVLRAGVQILHSFLGQLQTLSASIDAIDQPLMICDLEGRELHRNQPLRTLLLADKAGERLLTEHLQAYARRLSGLRPGGKPRGANGLGNLGPVNVSTQAGEYSLTGSYVPGFGNDGAILISLRPASPVLPDAIDLQDRFGLTSREAEVALLMARGHSNQEMAMQLRLSAHTVRHHAQRVLEKLGIQSRKALALHLLRHHRRNGH